MNRVYLWPDYGTDADPGDGGVRRVVEAQRRLLPEYGWEIVGRPEEADVLAAHMTATKELLAFNTDKPLVAHNHGLYWSEYEWGNWALKANSDCLRLIKAADATTAPTEWVANSIRRATSRDVRVIPHGVDLAEWPETDAHDGYVLWNKTRVDPVCDPGPMIAAAQLLPNVPFVTTVADVDVPANVQRIGKQPYEDAKRTVQRAGVYLATVRETFGIGTLEALAAGVPVVGFRWGGQEELITHLQDGYLAAPGDIEDLARGIRWALEYRDSISPWCRAKAEQYSWEVAIEQYAALYARVFEERQCERPKVSVIVTAYNLEKYLPAALASVQTQTFQDFECIVVDDASPDDCPKIADNIAVSDPRFRVIHNEKNEFLAESRNIGIRAARGRYILPLDADDQLAPLALEVLSTALDQQRELHIAYGGVVFTREDGTLEQYGGGRDAGVSGWPVPFNLQLMMRGPGQPLPYASMFRREAWRQTGGYRRRVRSSEDTDFWLRLTSYGFSAEMVTTAPTLIYRNRPESMSRQDYHEGAAADNRRWFPWVKQPALLPAGADRGLDATVPSFDPPRVALIIPVGPGHEHLVKDAIDSVDAQSYRQWECIVVNDSGAELPELPAWARVLDVMQVSWGEQDGKPIDAAIERREPVGVATARNTAIAASRAPAFLPLDADDYLEPGALAALMAAARECEGPTILYPDFWEDPDQPGVLRRYEFADYDASLLAKKALHSVTALTPRVAWEAIGGYDGTAPWEDWDFQLKCADAGFCSRRVSLPLFTYRKHTGTRRNDRYQRKDAALAAMQERWGDVVQGRKQLMACSSCSRGRTIGNVQREVPATDEDLVQLRFTGAERGNMQFRGTGTGTLYVFGAGKPPKFVHKDDAEGLLRRGTFEVIAREAVMEMAVGEAPELVASGPPDRSLGQDALRQTTVAPEIAAAVQAPPAASTSHDGPLPPPPPPISGRGAPFEKPMRVKPGSREG